ncbi:MFS transporter [Streptomyces sp. 5-6(2022)]|uniref:MFS transporter n=1 Tax=Streptomyces sp. 5-6(2022) TaxID=2936510 RepID=UPI0023B9FBC2|nr:MFS transporter [Streptomyces sp. 5-6(2022)]
MSTVPNDVAGQYRPAIVNKVKLRLVPFLALLYVIAFIDRANVGYAALDMNADLGISQAQFGLIAGLFSIGYFVFEVPSNMLMRKVGARRWIARILFSWGAVAVATGFVHNFTQLAIARVILGVAEAGFFPCVILYLSYWFPERERARVVAQFMVALPVATLIAGPLSGLILDHVHWFGVSGWRWVFIIEGLPAVLLGLVTLFLLTDTPQQAKWLSADDKAWLTATLEAENAAKTARNQRTGFWRSLAGWRTLALALIYYSKSVAIYVLAFFTPQIISGLEDNLSNTMVGVLSALPYGVAAMFMVWWARRSDRTRERRWHVALPLFVAAAGLCAMPLADNSITLSLLLLTVVTVAVYATYGPFWSLPSLFMTGSAAAVGMASINSIANLGGFVGPYGFGALQSATGGNNLGLALVAAVLIISGLLVVRLRFVRDAEATLRAPVDTGHDRTPTPATAADTSR